MNRRKLLKSAALVPLAATLPTFGDGPDSEDGPWAEGWEERCGMPDGLFNFQKEMWRDYQEHDYNLFILPLGGGKTFLADKLVQGWNHGCSYWGDNNSELMFDDPSLTILKKFRWETPCSNTNLAALFHGDLLIKKATIFATIHSDTNDFLRNMWNNEMSLFRNFNCKRFPLGEIDSEYVRDHYKFPKGFLKHYFLSQLL